MRSLHEECLDVDDNVRHHILSYLPILTKDDIRYKILKIFKNDETQKYSKLSELDDYIMLYNFSFISYYDLLYHALEKNNITDLYMLLK